jgi:hypothetical protein
MLVTRKLASYLLFVVLLDLYIQHDETMDMMTNHVFQHIPTRHNDVNKHETRLLYIEIDTINASDKRSQATGYVVIITGLGLKKPNILVSLSIK